jgi:hypothetical protein
MQSNTARLENQCVQITNFPKKTAKLEPEPFTVVDGHYVGSDGFVVPRDFDEFSSRFPNYVRKWVRKHSGGAYAQRTWTTGRKTSPSICWHSRPVPNTETMASKTSFRRSILSATTEPTRPGSGTTSTCA